MAVIRRDPEQVEQLEIKIPAQANGANTLYLVNGRIVTSSHGTAEGSGPEIRSASETYLFHAGPELDPVQVRIVRATASVAGVYASLNAWSADLGQIGDWGWTLAQVDAVHDDDARRARVMITTRVFARHSGIVRIDQLAFELRILART